MIKRVVCCLTDLQVGLLFIWIKPWSLSMDLLQPRRVGLLRKEVALFVPLRTCSFVEVQSVGVKQVSTCKEPFMWGGSCRCVGTGCLNLGWFLTSKISS